MKKLISILLTAVMVFGAVPFSAFASPIDYGAETSASQNAEELTAETAGTSLPDGISTYDENYGELVYFEDFEDGSLKSAYTTLPGSYIEYWSKGEFVDNPVGKGKAFINTSDYLQFMIGGDYSTAVTKVTFMVDLLNYGEIGSNIPVNFMDSWLSPWEYWKIADISKTEWTTKTVTQDVSCNATNKNMRFYFGGKGIYVDNVRVYLKKNEVGLPSDVPAVDETYGTLVYYENFDDGSKGRAYFSDSKMQPNLWTSGEIVNDPAKAGKAYKNTADYLQFQIAGDWSLDCTKVTLMLDILNPDGVSGSVPVNFMDNWLSPWDYWKNSEFSKTVWTTKTVTKDISCTASKSNMLFYFGGKGMYFDNIKVYLKTVEKEPEHSAKPDETYIDGKGNLVFFDNFSGADFGNTADIKVLGAGKTVITVDGKKAVACDSESLGSSNRTGLFLQAADGVSFKYTDGREMKGNFYVLWEMYSTAANNQTFFIISDKNPGWDSWEGMYTAWNGGVASSKSWGKIFGTLNAQWGSTVGFLNSASLGTKISTASVAVYFKPDNALKLSDGKNTRLIDLNGLDKVTLPEPTDTALKGWKDENGNIYLAKQEVSASALSGKTLTAQAVDAAKVEYSDGSYEYVLLENGTAVYTVKTNNYPEWDISIDGTVKECIGWSSAENASEAETAVTVTSSGVKLYPVWKLISDTVNYEISIDGAKKIELDNVERTYTYKAVFAPSIEYNGVEWSSSDSEIASIGKDGVLTPKTTGKVKITAKADYYPQKEASVDVEIVYKDGYAPITVSFGGNIEKAPESFTVIPGRTFDLGDYLGVKPTESGKLFNGWILNGDTSKVYTGKVTALSSDMKFTALVNYDINFALEQKDLNAWYNYGTLKKDSENEVWTGVPNLKNNDNYIEIRNLHIPSAKFSACEWYLDVNYVDGVQTKQFKVGDAVTEFYYHTPNGDYKGCLNGEVTAITDDGKYAVVKFNLDNSSWTGTVTGIRCDFLGNGYFGYSFRYFRLIEKPAADGNELTISGITSPVTGFAPKTDAKIAEKFAKIESVTWQAEDGGSFLSTGNFNENTVYTVEIKVSASDSSYILGDGITATVDGREAEVTRADDGSAVVSLTYPSTDAFIDFDMEIEGRTVISRTDRSFAYTVKTSADIPDKTAVWSVDDSEIAAMTEDGKLLAKKNGTVKITAVSSYNPAKKAEFTVKIENIDVTYVNVSFDKATSDTVSGMPENFSAQAGKIELPSEKPTRDGYIFLGWTLGTDSVETIEKLTADEDVTLCALWGIGVMWDFSSTKDGFSIGNASSSTHETYLEVKTGTGSDDIRMTSPSISLDPKRYSKAVMRLAVEKTGEAQIFFSADGSGINEGRSVKVEYTGEGLDDWQTLTFDFSAMGAYTSAKAITRFWVDPYQYYSTTARIDYICVLDSYRTITFDANGGTLPEAYADGISKQMGEKIALGEEAKADGKTFLGWSESKDGGELVRSVTVRENMKLYAVYGENTENGAFVLEDGEVILVKAPANTSVKITYTAGGSPKTKTVTTGENGYAVAELETGAEISDFETSLGTAVITDAVTAQAILNEKNEKEFVSSDILINGKPADGSDGTASKNFDKTVTDVTKPGTIVPGNADESERTAADDLAQGGTVFFGFDKEYEKSLFTSVENLERGYEPDSVLSYRIFTKNTGASVTPELLIENIALDADETKYVIIRARVLGFENPNLRLFFKNEKVASYTKLASVVNTLSDEYAVYVYNMGANKSWGGTVNSLRFVSENNSQGSIDIDWICFADEIPESTDEFNGYDDVFAAVNSGKLPFADVASNEWSYSEISQAYKRGFVNGKSETAFAPDDGVTVAEAITLAVRISTIINGGETIQNSADGNWYDSYVSAAIKAKIIKPNQFDDYDRPATRRETAVIMKNAVPNNYLGAINIFDEVPDVETGSDGAKAILALYCAGVLNGSDSEYNFMPESGITRAELAAIANRLAFPSARKRIYTSYERLANRITYKGNQLAGIILWSCTKDYLSVDGDGIGWGTSTGTDPIVLLHEATGKFDGAEVTRIILGVVYDKDDVTLTPEIYYATSSANSYSWGRRIEGAVGETDENGVTEVVFDVSNAASFKETVTQLRFDPFEVTGKKFGIAYIIVE